MNTNPDAARIGKIDLIGSSTGFSLQRNSIAFLLALLIYSTLSTPFPQNPGPIEAGIALLLALYITIPLGVVIMAGGFTILRDRQQAVPMWLHIAFFFFVWWNTINGGIIRQWGAVDIIRDLVPCIYLFMPVFFLPVMTKAKENWSVLLAWTLAGIGVILSLRFYYITGISPLEVGSRYFTDNLLYIPYDPSIPFASVFLPIMAFRTLKLSRPITLLTSLLMMIGGFLALGSLMAVAQRAPLGMAALFFGIYFVAASYKSLPKMLGGVACLALFIALTYQQLLGSYELLMAKQETFGANGKFDELFHVLKEISQKPDTLLFGTGWGGLFHDPAVGGMAVSYTHSVITYFMLKGGMVGIAILILYLLWILKHLFGALTLATLPFILASVESLVIGLLFQVSYKALTYGIILTLVCLVYHHVVRQKRLDREAAGAAVQ